MQRHVQTASSHEMLESWWQSCQLAFDTFAAGLIQAVRIKTAGLHVALWGNFSGPVRAIDLVKGPKDLSSLVVCTRKNSLVGGCGFFVSDVISGGHLGHLGPLHLTLGLNR